MKNERSVTIARRDSWGPLRRRPDGASSHLARRGRVPAVLGLKEQAAVYDGWLKLRLEKRPARAHAAGEASTCGSSSAEEYNEDPVYLSLVPFTSLSARRLSILVFFDRGEEKGVERLSVSRYGIGDLYPTVWKAGPGATSGRPWPRSSRSATPKRIGIDEVGDVRFRRRPVRLQEKAPRPSPRPGVCRNARRRPNAWPSAGSNAGLPEELEVYPHIVAHRPRDHRRRVLARGHHARRHDDGGCRVVDAGTVRATRLQTTWFQPSISIQRPAVEPLQGRPGHPSRRSPAL